MNRTQIYLSESQHEALSRLASERSTTASALIRDAIDSYLASQLSRRERVDALRQFALRMSGAGSLSDGEAIVDELRATAAERLRFDG